MTAGGGAKGGGGLAEDCLCWEMSVGALETFSLPNMAVNASGNREGLMEPNLLTGFSVLPDK